MSAPGTVRGTIRGSSNKPLALIAEKDGGYAISIGPDTPQTKTVAEGGFEFVDVAPGLYLMVSPEPGGDSYTMLGAPCASTLIVKRLIMSNGPWVFEVKPGQTVDLGELEKNLSAIATPDCSDSSTTSTGTVLKTPSDVFHIVGISSSDRFPPGCTQQDAQCQGAAPGYQIFIIWLQPRGSIDPSEGGYALSQEAKSAYLTAPGGLRANGVGGGLFEGKWFILFTPPDSASDFVLHWFDNPPVKLDAPVKVDE